LLYIYITKFSTIDDLMTKNYFFTSRKNKFYESTD